MATIRPYQPGDEQGMYQAHIRAVRDVCTQSYSSRQIELWLQGRDARTYLEGMTQKNEQFWVLELEDGEIGGFGAWQGDEITHLYVHPQYIGQGYGRLLFEAIENDYFKSTGNSICRIASTLNAKDFYSHMGAKVVKLGLQTLHDGQTVIGAWHMQKPMPAHMLVERQTLSA